MRIVVQRSLNSFVKVHDKIVGEIDRGLVLLIGFAKEDQIEDLDYMLHKVLNLRIFSDDEGKMNQSILDINGKILSISQFTLQADTKKGNRPSFQSAMPYDEAKDLYEIWNQKLRQFVWVETGKYGEDMQVQITNDGPVTILLESRENYVKR